MWIEVSQLDILYYEHPLIIKDTQQHTYYHIWCNTFIQPVAEVLVYIVQLIF